MSLGTVLSSKEIRLRLIKESISISWRVSIQWQCSGIRTAHINYPTLQVISPTSNCTITKYSSLIWKSMRWYTSSIGSSSTLHLKSWLRTNTVSSTSKLALTRTARWKGISKTLSISGRQKCRITGSIWRSIRMIPISASFALIWSKLRARKLPSSILWCQLRDFPSTCRTIRSLRITLIHLNLPSTSTTIIKMRMKRSKWISMYWKALWWSRRNLAIVSVTHLTTKCSKLIKLYN